ncbi:hypothetical protein PR048_006782 [Dryococelus australis]|uniref:Uncharacterized protein n=1 Tax=Dryococelus australis TaxID=614101 RepID=A0ABQ9ICJ0_9NEOP|nr:hypothetical protein PR048_006782 [Dryococelus australis]
MFSRKKMKMNLVIRFGLVREEGRYLVLRADEDQTRRVWSNAGMQEREGGMGHPLENSPTSGMISTCENPGATPAAIESGSRIREPSSLITTPPRPLMPRSFYCFLQYTQCDENHSTSVQSLAFSGDGVLVERGNVAVIAPAPFSLKRRAWVVERLACSPPIKVDQVQSPAGSPGFHMWESCRTMPLVGWFSRGSPVSNTPSFWRCSTLTRITLICSQDLVVKTHANLFNSLHFCRIKHVHRVAAGQARVDGDGIDLPLPLFGSAFSSLQSSQPPPPPQNSLSHGLYVSAAASPSVSDRLSAGSPLKLPGATPPPPPPLPTHPLEATLHVESTGDSTKQGPQFHFINWLSLYSVSPSPPSLLSTDRALVLARGDIPAVAVQQHAKTVYTSAHIIGCRYCRRYPVAESEITQGGRGIKGLACLHCSSPFFLSGKHGSYKGYTGTRY